MRPGMQQCQRHYPEESLMLDLGCSCCCCFGGGGGGGVGNGQGGGGGGPGSSRKQCWAWLIFLAVMCSGAYIFLYYRATLNNSSFVLSFPRISSAFRSPTDPPSTVFPPFASVPPVLHPRAVPPGPINNSRWNASELLSAAALRSAIDNGTAQPLLTLFSTWPDLPDHQLVRNLTLMNWKQLAPFIRPVLFTNNPDLAEEALGRGWDTLPVSKTAVGVPILKNMYMDAMKSFNSSLYAFANGDILFTMSLVNTLLSILTDPSLPLDTKPTLVIGQRVNVDRVTEEEAQNFDNLTRMAKRRGKNFITMAEDFFITDRRFPWSDIPGVVIGRPAYDNWLVLYAIQNKYVVVDVTKTALAVHQTTKAGNSEGFSHPNASYNDRMLTKMYKRVHYMGGCVDCAPWLTRQARDGKIHIEERTPRPKHCL